MQESTAHAPMEEPDLEHLRIRCLRLQAQGAARGAAERRRCGRAGLSQRGCTRSRRRTSGRPNGCEGCPRAHLAPPPDPLRRPPHPNNAKPRTPPHPPLTLLHRMRAESAKSGAASSAAAHGGERKRPIFGKHPRRAQPPMGPSPLAVLREGRASAARHGHAMKSGHRSPCRSVLGTCRNTRRKSATHALAGSLRRARARPANGRRRTHCGAGASVHPSWGGAQGCVVRTAHVFVIVPSSFRFWAACVPPTCGSPAVHLPPTCRPSAA